MNAQTCPVCRGKGTVPVGFYEHGSFSSSTATHSEDCRSCMGKGYIVLDEYFAANVEMDFTNYYKPNSVNH